MFFMVFHTILSVIILFEFFPRNGHRITLLPFKQRSKYYYFITTTRENTTFSLRAFASNDYAGSLCNQYGHMLKNKIIRNLPKLIHFVESAKWTMVSVISARIGTNLPILWLLTNSLTTTCIQSNIISNNTRTYIPG